MRNSLLMALVLVSSAQADSFVQKLSPLLAEAERQGWVRSALGVTRLQTSIPFLATAHDLDPATTRTRLLLVGGLEDNFDSTRATLSCLKWFHTSDAAREFRSRYSLAAVPCLNIDGRKTDLLHGYPPRGDAYQHLTDPERQYLWSWLGVFAPDLVVTISSGKERAWGMPTEGVTRAHDQLRLTLAPKPSAAGLDHLVRALGQGLPGGVGHIPAVALITPADSAGESLAELLAGLEKARFSGPSPARREIQKRTALTPLQVALNLSRRYGQELRTVEYISAMALVGRLRLGERSREPIHRTDVERIVGPHLRKKTPGVEKANPSQLAGYLVFGELARITGEDKYTKLVVAAADRCTSDAGVPGHSDMSDAVFMGCPLLARAGRLTGERKYHEACLKNLLLMQKLCLRRDGLYRHSPLDEAAWGRGNGFPALGLALSLSDLPAEEPARATILKAFQDHMKALLRHQDLDGCWHQVIDVPGSYRELSSTCMITLAMARGVRNGWLERKTFEPAVRRGWQAIQSRISGDGSLLDVCTGTGKQKTLRDYLDRKAIQGPDPRGGAMALLVAVEMAERE